MGSFFRGVNKMRESLIIKSQNPPKREDFKKFRNEISTDWDGHSLPFRPFFLFWIDQRYLHFWAAVEGSSGLPHLDGKTGSYQAELWKYDVAEFFLATPDRSRYLEFNLSPVGAWWSCLFGDRLVPLAGEPAEIPGVTATGQQSDSSWEARASLPLEWIEERFPLDLGVGLNTTFILNTPNQIFVTASDLGPGIPDFHRPKAFPVAKPGAPA